ncbi:MAG: 4-hydroxy-3-methylbut-2-enyl diphosphate reductase [Bacteroidales bacterium]|jgi:4-hydroxy-3-methylbut-2-enyl diphosphate reductase|nr:4-hydroxy-3-methylbut-2-enyl diphosphate reductase [Bacteroidales bacterium]
MKCVIDRHSGFCSGVIKAIQNAEKYLQHNPKLYCLGDIVHNSAELQRLRDMGLEIISYKEFLQLKDTTVLIRAHGEPPETYDIARKNNITVIDATCPVVLHLQKNIRNNCENPTQSDTQILIFGKTGHAEVIGLLGQTQNKGIVLSTKSDISKINLNKPAQLYSQTTQSVEDYSELIDLIAHHYKDKGNEHLFNFSDTICRSVANRSKQIRDFASQFDKIFFVSDEKSSNGLYLFGICKAVNSETYFIANPEDVRQITINQNDTVGICGATSTPMWLMEKVKEMILY